MIVIYCKKRKIDTCPLITIRTLKSFLWGVWLSLSCLHWLCKLDFSICCLIVLVLLQRKNMQFSFVLLFVQLLTIAVSYCVCSYKASSLHQFSGPMHCNYCNNPPTGKQIFREHKVFFFQWWCSQISFFTSFEVKKFFWTLCSTVWKQTNKSHIKPLYTHTNKIK